MSMDFDAHIRQLETHGFAIMEGAVEAALCDEIIAEIERLEAEGEPSLKGNAFVGYKTVRYFDLMYRLNLAIIQALEAGGVQISAPRKLT